MGLIYPESKRNTELCFGKQSVKLGVCLRRWYHELLANIGDSKNLLKSLEGHVKEHFPNASYGAYPIENDSKIALLIVANKYSPNNFWCVGTLSPAD